MLPRWLGRCWPQKVRTRLTLIYAGLFLAGGSALLGLTYGLVASSLPAHPTITRRPVLSQQEFIQLCKHAQPTPSKTGEIPQPSPDPAPSKTGKTPQPSPDPAPTTAADPNKVAELCQQAAAAGYSAGSASQRDRALHSLLLFSLIGLGVMTLASGGAGWVVSGRVLRPVRAITEAARRASEQHLGERLALTGARDELRELADTFDDMLERLDQAFVAQRRFVANASHELRTPLTIMRTAIDVTLAKPSRTPEQLEAMAVRVRRSIDRAESMIDALLTLAISDQGPASSEPVDLSTAAEDALDVAAAGIGQLSLRVDSRLEPAETTGDPHLLERMIGNLVDNAVRHNEPGGWIRLSTGAQDGSVFLQIANSGPHVPDDAVPTLFEPFRRIEGRTATSDGVGLGLSIVKSIVAAHGATVVARSQPEGGLDVRVALPARDAAVIARAFEA
jgi:signal transduction histidine kinase